MKKTVKRIAAMLVIAVLTLSLTACSDEALQLLRGIVTATAPVTEVTPIGGADEPAVIVLQGAEETHPDPVGVWKDTDCYDAMVVVAMGLGYSEEEAEELAAALGDAVYTVTLNPDKTGTVCFETAFNTTKENFTWTADDEAITLTGDDGSTSVMKWDSGKLLYEYEGLQLVLEKEENTVSPAPEAGEKSPVGIWEITNLRQIATDLFTAQGLSPEQIDIMLENMSVSAKFIIAENGTFMLIGKDMTGGTVTRQGTWTAADTGVTLILDGSPLDLVWDGDALVGEEDGLTIRLEQPEAPECWVTGVQNNASIEIDPVGSWECVNLRECFIQDALNRGDSMEEAEAELARLGDISARLQLFPDGTATFTTSNMYINESETGTWEPTEKGILISGMTVLDSPEFLWDGTSLTTLEEGILMIFEKTESPAISYWFVSVPDAGKAGPVEPEQ